MTLSASVYAARGDPGGDGMAQSSPPAYTRWLFYIARLCAAVLIALGSLVILGWLVNSEPLMSVVPGLASMKANTAVCFIAIGTALAMATLLPSSKDGQTGRLATTGLRICAFLAFACGACTLIEFVCHVDLHIDQLLFSDRSPWAFPGRMAPLTAINFTMSGLTLFFVGGRRPTRRPLQMAALAIAAGAFVGIVGYLYGVPLFYGSTGYTSMALHTGLGFLVLSLGMMTAQPQSRLVQLVCGPRRGSWLARRLFPAILIGPVILGWFYLQPAVSSGHPRFSLALFAVTLVVLGSVGLSFVASMLNQAEFEREQIAAVREQSAAAIRQSEHELRLVTDHLPVLLSYIDPGGRFVRVNRTYEDWLNVPASSIVGRTVSELLGEEYWARILPLRSTALRGETAMVETLYPTVRGDRRVQITYAPDTTDAGEVRGFACMVVDIDDHRRAEEALRQSEKLAVVGRLASSIAHEINNPLEAITNLLYLLEQDTVHQEPAHYYVLQAQEALARVTHIVVETLRFHRQSTHPTRCRPADLVGQVIALYRGRLVNAHLEIEVRFREKVLLLCREGEIRQVLANLIGNAIDATSRGGRLFVRTHTFEHPLTGQQGIVLTVADTGSGIRPETLAKIFEPFYTTKGVTGSGLGLWISKEIVDRHHGSVRVRSSLRPGASGTVFRVFLPESPTDVSEEQEMESVPPLAEVV